MSGIDGGLLPVVDVVSAPFWDGCAAGELRVQRCGDCGERRMPPRPMCPACRSLNVVWEPTSGLGRIWSFVVAHPPLLAAYDAQAPYNVIVVELDENPSIRFVGNLVSSADGRLDEVDPATIRIGDAVRVVFASPVEDDAGPVTFPRWILR